MSVFLWSACESVSVCERAYVCVHTRRAPSLPSPSSRKPAALLDSSVCWETSLARASLGHSSDPVQQGRGPLSCPVLAPAGESADVPESPRWKALGGSRRPFFLEVCARTWAAGGSTGPTRGGGIFLPPCQDAAVTDADPHSGADPEAPSMNLRARLIHTGPGSRRDLGPKSGDHRPGAVHAELCPLLLCGLGRVMAPL